MSGEGQRPEATRKTSMYELTLAMTDIMPANRGGSLSAEGGAASRSGSTDNGLDCAGGLSRRGSRRVSPPNRRGSVRGGSNSSTYRCTPKFRFLIQKINYSRCTNKLSASGSMRNEVK